MANKEYFKKVEEMLYKYYDNKKSISKYKSSVVILYKHQEQLKQEMKEPKGLELTAYDGMGIDYAKDIVTFSSDNAGSAEKETIRYINNLEKDYKYIVQKIIKQNTKIRELELEIYNVEFNVNMLSEEFKRFVELKYRDKKSVDWIAVEMYGGARSTAYRKREEIIDSIGMWLELIDSM